MRTLKVFVQKGENCLDSSYQVTLSYGTKSVQTTV